MRARPDSCENSIYAVGVRIEMKINLTVHAIYKRLKRSYPVIKEVVLEA